MGRKTKYQIIGREKEIKKLDEIFKSKEAEFAALYGRRRVGKTYLIRQFFKSKPCVFFEVTGSNTDNLREQLESFTHAVEETFYQGTIRIVQPKRWRDALQLLTDRIKEIPGNKKIVIFFDELPWLATRKSGVLGALDLYWNTKWSEIPKLKLIVCGSAASWMLKKLIHTKGGLHNRITDRVWLMPFTLKEAREYLGYRGIRLNELQVLEIYMAMGGVPHYLKTVSRGLSATQNINKACFQPDGLLLDEFDKIFPSLFDSPEANMEIIQTLAQYPSGLSRDELLEKLKLSSSGGTFKERMLELEKSGFVIGFTPYGYANKGTYYRIIDEYTLFYLNWIHPVRKRVHQISTNYWETKVQTQPWKTWAGYAFEAICFKHINQICNALEISAIPKEIGSWRYIPPAKNKKKEAGAQIDLLVDRADGIINICEVKHYNQKFTIDKSYAAQLRHKIEIFRERRKTKKQLFLTMITTHGITWNEYARELVTREITLKDLFK